MPGVVTALQEKEKGSRSQGIKQNIWVLLHRARQISIYMLISIYSKS
jgi:hypothetical protein